MTFFKKPHARDRAYRRLAASKPCVLCGSTGTNAPHHPLGAEWNTGRAYKACDYTVISLCHFHHLEYHKLTAGPWEEKYGRHADILADFLARHPDLVAAQLR